VFTVQYSSTRAEVWRWYWRAWAKPAGLWRYHVLFGLAIAVGLAAGNGFGMFELRRFTVTAVLATLGCVVLLPLWPQIRFKSAQRSLTIDAEGWKTEIGKLSGARPWKQVRSIEDTGDTIAIVGTNRNALIVPTRAFPNTSARKEFLTAARTVIGPPKVCRVG
jgi:hypothetical protein